RPWMVMVSSSVTELVLMLAFISALHWFVVATTNRSIFRTEGLFYCFCCTSDYIRTKLHPDRMEVDPINGNPQESRSANLHARHGHCHEATTRAHGDHLPPGVRDKPQDTEERRETKVCAMSRTDGIVTTGDRSSRQRTPRRTTYLTLKGGGDRSMLVKRGITEDVYG